MTGKQGNTLPEYSVDQAVNSLLSSEEPIPALKKVPEEGLEEEEVLSTEADDNAELEDESEEDEHSTLEADSEDEEDDLESEDDLEKDESEDDGELYTLELDGEEIQVTRDELLKGYRRQKDYTRKFQELAEQRKSFEAQSQQYQQAIASYTETVTALQQHLFGQGIEDPDPAMKDIDPVGYLEAKENVRSRREQLQQLEAAKQNAHREYYQHQQQELQKIKTEERDKLINALPEWKNPEVAKKEKDEIKRFGASIGFTPQELDAVVDHRAVLVLRDAMRYRQLNGSKAPKVKKVKSTVKTIVPRASKAANSTSTTKNRRAEKTALERLSKSGSIDDAIDLVLARQR